MTVYVVVINDRHTDPDAEVFSTKEAAVEHAKRIATEYAANGAVTEIDEDIGDWLYCLEYSVEGDRVWVVKKELQ